MNRIAEKRKKNNKKFMMVCMRTRDDVAEKKSSLNEAK